MRTKKKPLRRKKGTGSIKERGGKFFGVIRRNKVEETTGLFATEGEAASALDRLIGTGIDPRLLPSLSDYWEQVLRQDGDLEHKLDPTTCDLYDTVRATTIHGKKLGKLRLDQIRTVDVQRHIDALYKTYAASTVKRYGSCVRQVLQLAVSEGLISARMEAGKYVPANPADGVKFRPIPDTPAYILSEQELGDLPEMLYAYNKRLSAMVTVNADTGVRPGELCGMKMEDIDVENRIWTVKDTRRRDGSLKGTTKNHRIRAIKLTEDAFAAIISQKVKRGPVWLNEDGNPVNPGAYYLHLKRFITTRKLPRGIMPRNFRKTFVTLATETGGLKAAQVLAGHRSIETTGNVYAKARLNAQAETVDGIEKMVGKRGLFDDRGTDRGTKKQSASRVEPA